MIINQNLPRLTKRKKRLNLEPLRKPGYKDFAAALQNRSPELFKVMQSQAEGAGHGMFMSKQKNKKQEEEEKKIRLNDYY